MPSFTWKPNPKRHVVGLMAASAIMALPMVASAATVEVTAKSYGEKVTLTVPMDHADSEDGVEKIYARMEKKAEIACKRDIPRARGRTVNKSRCESQLMNGFVSDLEHEGVSALHATRTD